MTRAGGRPLRLPPSSAPGCCHASDRALLRTTRCTPNSSAWLSFGWPHLPFSPSCQHSQLTPAPAPHPVPSSLRGHLAGQRPFPVSHQLFCCSLSPPVMLSTVTAAEVQLRATSEPSFPGHCLLLLPAPAGRPAFSPVLLQCWSFDDRKPRSHQEAPLTCAWEARLLPSQGMEEAGGCVPITHQALCTVETAGCDPQGS